MLKRLCLFASLLTICFGCTEDPTFTDDQTQPNEPTPNVNIPDDLDDEYRQLIELVNEIRASGCQCGNSFQPPTTPLSWNAQLATAAQRHSQDMQLNNHFSHQGTDGSSFSDRISQTGYQWRTVGENIALNFLTAQTAFEGWKNSPGHCRNMMNANFQEMGAAREGAYYTQDFGTQR